MIHALKYRGWRNMAELMGKKMAGEGPPRGSDPVLVPVPTTARRRRIRGYNQAAVLAGALSKLWKLPVQELLIRPSGRSQVRLGPRERAANVEGAFQLSGGFRSRIGGQDVILVDDVLTTGATAKAAALALAEGGIGSVHLRTFARALPFALQ
jgi:ComF family protein